MKADPRGVLSGTHFIDGDHAYCEGALAAGARFAAGYPITPSTEVVERFSQRIPTVGGTFVQMEDELAASIAIQGAVWGGAKAFTVTSGPGFSLMMEHIGYAAMTETPCVFVNVQRGGPSTGMPTRTQQSDVLACAYASHGDTKHVLLFPEDPKECFEFAAEALDLADRLQTPVFVMTDLDIGMNQRLCKPLEWDDARSYDRGKVMSREELEAGKELRRDLGGARGGPSDPTHPGTPPQPGAPNLR